MADAVPLAHRAGRRMCVKVGLCAVVSVGALLTGTPASGQTADQSASWLVLYNTNLPDSIAWAQWYQVQRGIPQDHLLGLSASSSEHLPDLASVQTQIISPVRDYLANHPEIAQQVMGIILGYGLPGHYAQPPASPGIGGFSVTDALQDMTDDTLPPAVQKGQNLDCPQGVGLILPTARLTKSTMQPGHYMTARIDGPTSADAMLLTTRALRLSQSSATLHGQHVWFDYQDPTFPSPGHEWTWLRLAVTNPQLAEIPWTSFDLKGQNGSQQTPQAAFRFDTYKLYGWNVADFVTDDPGDQVLAFDFNSFGAVTVRSTTGQGGVLVPNALAAGYTAAIGATGEPQSFVGPFPDTVLAALREGWTLGEAFYLANPYNDWMWTLIGDPLLTLPNWFNPVEITPGNGDINQDGVVDGCDIQSFIVVMTGANSDPAARGAADLNGDGVINADDAFLLMGPLVFDSYDPSILRGSGDANGDGILDGRDIAAFVDKLIGGLHGDEPLRERFAADMNKDGLITVDDVPLFIQTLLR
jgi:uncharacterized protein (TIGR03790 family)